MLDHRYHNIIFSVNFDITFFFEYIEIVAAIQHKNVKITMESLILPSLKQYLREFI